MSLIHAEAPPPVKWPWQKFDSSKPTIGQEYIVACTHKNRRNVKARTCALWDGSRWMIAIQNGMGINISSQWHVTHFMDMPDFPAGGGETTR